MARGTIFLLGAIFVFFLLSLLPVGAQIVSDGTRVPVGDLWELTFVKLAGSLDAVMPHPLLVYDDTAERYTVTAAGHGIGDSQDGCAFIYVEVLSGDWSVRVRIEGQFSGPSTSGWSRAGLMVRDSVTPESKFVFYHTTRANGDAVMAWRDTDDAVAAAGTDDAAGGLFYPYYLRLDRVGGEFTGYYSTDVASWTKGSIHTNNGFSDPVYIGMALTSGEVDIPTTIVFSKFSVPGYEGPCLACAGPDQWVYGNEVCTLDGSRSTCAIAYSWSQVKKPGDPDITIYDADKIVAKFTPPGTQIGYTLTFRLTTTEETGADEDEVQYFVRAINPPKVAPNNFFIRPLHLTGEELGFWLEWDPVFDATYYEVYWYSEYWPEPFRVPEPCFESTGMIEGAARRYCVRGENKFSVPASVDPSKHGVRSPDIVYTAMPNLARPASLGGTRPPLPPIQGVTYVFSRLNIAGMNDRASNDNNDSNNGILKPLDFWGYVWDQPYFFDHIVYYCGIIRWDGGWFTSLKVQFSEDGSTWKDVPILRILPEYDFSDTPVGKKAFTRYDIVVPTLRGTGIRIAGAPGGISGFSSISELEVFGNQNRGPLIVQGIDATYREGSTATLDGSLSFSTSGPITSYSWSFVSGPDFVTIENPDSAVATFKAPIGTKDEVFVFKLAASDGTRTGYDHDVRITVKNVETKGVAGPDQKVFEGSVVTLDGSGSQTATGNITYLWTQTAGTDIGVTGETTATVEFTAPTIWGYTEDMTFQLKVDDGASGISSDEVQVQVRNKLAAPLYPLGPGYVKDLLHLGANPTDRILSPLNIYVDHLAAFGGQAQVNPVEGDAYDFSGTGIVSTRNPMVWTPVHSTDGFFSGEPLDHFIQYYHVCILSPEERNARLHFRNGDGVRMWNNGVLVVCRDGWDNGTEQTQDFTLYKGLNLMAFKLHEAGGGNYLAVGITDRTDQPYNDLHYALGPSFVLSDAYAVRMLPSSYQPAGTSDASLMLKVNPNNKPETVTIWEQIPEGLTESDVSAPGATVQDGAITWTLTGEEVESTTLDYALNIPQSASRILGFTGTVSFDSTTVEVYGDDSVYPVPSEPRYLEVEMLVAAHLSWSPPASEGTREYIIYRSDNGGPWEKIATVAATSYVDNAASRGVAYSYKVAAVNAVGAEGTASAETQQASLPDMVIREAEDVNCHGEPSSDPYCCRNEAPSADDLGEEWDFFQPNYPLIIGQPPIPPWWPPECGWLPIETVLNEGTTDVYHTNLSWIDVGSWWRYTFYVTKPGWIKLDFRVASPGGGILAAYWDEAKLGTVSYVTGSWHRMTWAAMDDQIQATYGRHVLRVQSVSGQLNFDKIAIGFNWTPPKRRVIWADRFDSYNTTSDATNIGGWTILNNSREPAAAWQLWDTENNLGANPGNLEGMADKYLITNSDFAPTAQMDEELISPEIDCSWHTEVRLKFDKNFRVYPDDTENDSQVGEVDIRVCSEAAAWGDWVNLRRFEKNKIDPTLDPADDAAPEELDLSAYDGKKIQLRWHFYNVFYDYWFAVDEVEVSGHFVPPEPTNVRTELKENTLKLRCDGWSDGKYTVQYSDDLVGGIWLNAPGTWPVTAGFEWDDDIADIPQRFYRIITSPR